MTKSKTVIHVKLMVVLAFHVRRQSGGHPIVHDWQERQCLESGEVKQKIN